MKHDSFDQPPSRWRAIGRRVFVWAALAYLIVAAAMTAVVWVQKTPGVNATPKLEENPPFPNPQVLHQEILALPVGVVAVPFQAGHYEIAQVLPAEVTVFYRHAQTKSESRVVLFTQPLHEHWRLTGPLPGGRWRVEDLLAVLSAGKRPSLGSYLLPWRLQQWRKLRQAQAVILRDDGGDTWTRFWRVKGERMELVGRDHTFAQRTGGRVAVTIFQPNKTLDLHFVFAEPHPDNQALIAAWLLGVQMESAKKPDNLAGLAACDRLPSNQPNDPAIRLCRELYLLAAWHSQNKDWGLATQLVDAYVLARDRVGLQALSDQLSILRSEDPQARKITETILKHLTAMKQEEAAKAAAANEAEDE